jgi:hypothetical protein
VEPRYNTGFKTKLPLDDVRKPNTKQLETL